MKKANRLYHLLDRWAGIPIVIILGIFCVKRKFPSAIQEIAVINLASIGDSVLMSAVIADIKLQYPESRLVAFVGESNFELAKLIEGIDCLEKIALKNPLTLFTQIRKQKQFDLLIDFGQWPRINAIFSFFIKSKFRIGFKKTHQFRHFIYDKTAEHSDEIHELNNFRNLTSSFYSKPFHNPSLRKVACNEKATKFISQSKRYCIIHAWSGGLRAGLKQWPNERWAKLIEKIKDDFDCIFITGSKKDIENSEVLCSLAKAGAKNVHSLAGQFNLNEMICILRNSSLVITIDTGIAHLAAALNKTQLCLIRHVFHMQWRPWGENVHTIYHKYNNVPNKDAAFKKKIFFDYCLENVSVEMVYNKYKEIKSQL